MKTIKCRIALAVDPKGHWAATGGPTLREWRDCDYILDNLSETYRRYWVEVEVPVPDAEPPTVQGKATEVQP